MSTLAQIPEKVRTQTDLDSEDLPDTTLDGFIREAFNRTFAAERKWPFFEHTVTLTKSIGDTTIDMPIDPEVAFIQRVRDSDNYNLVHLAQQLAEETFQGTQSTGTPQFFSVWDGVISLWPTPVSDEELTFTLRGYRKPTWTGVAGDELDGDGRLHLPIFHYAVSLTYAQLEDTELEADYMQRWAAGLADIRADIMRPQYHEPLIVNGGKQRPAWRSLVNWSVLQ
jgi:hypothetical protein